MLYHPKSNNGSCSCNGWGENSFVCRRTWSSYLPFYEFSATFCPFPRRCVDLWVEGLNSQASTLASPWHVAYGFKNRLALREIFSRQTAWILTNSSGGL